MKKTETTKLVENMWPDANGFWEFAHRLYELTKERLKDVRSQQHDIAKAEADDCIETVGEIINEYKRDMLFYRERKRDVLKGIEEVLCDILRSAKDIPDLTALSSVREENEARRINNQSDIDDEMIERAKREAREDAGTAIETLLTNRQKTIKENSTNVEAESDDFITYDLAQQLLIKELLNEYQSAIGI